MTLFDLLFIALVLAAAGTSIAAGASALRGQRARAVGILRRLGVCAVVYVAIVYLATALSKSVVLFVPAILSAATTGASQWNGWSGRLATHWRFTTLISESSAVPDALPSVKTRRRAVSAHAHALAAAAGQGFLSPSATRRFCLGRSSVIPDNHWRAVGKPGDQGKISVHGLDRLSKSEQQKIAPSCVPPSVLASLPK